MILCNLCHCMLNITISIWMRLDTVDNMRVGHEHVDNLTTPLVPKEHTTTVTTTQYPVLSPEVGLLDLGGEGRERGRERERVGEREKEREKEREGGRGRERERES